jgi:FixJ family two-component response regulator
MSKAQKIVVVVDDDQSVRDSLAWLLSSVGLRVTTYANANDFLACYRPGTADCLALDVRLPDLSGLEVQAEMEQRGWRIPTVIITGHGDVDMAVRAMKAGAVDFIQKPFAEQTLLEAIQRAIDIGRRAPPASQHGRAPACQHLQQLTRREREIMKLIVNGMSSKQIAASLNISIRTVETHRRQIMRKTRAANLAELIHICLNAARDESLLPHDRAQ